MKSNKKQLDIHGSDILVVDDEADIRDLISGILNDEGHHARTAHDSDSALAAISQRRPSLIFLDIWMQKSKLDGLELLDVIRNHHPDLPVIIISGHGNIETAVSAIKSGAYDYIEKPFKVDRLLLIAARALENSNLRKQIKHFKRLVGDMPELIGNSNSAQNLRSTIEKVALGNSRIMIIGPIGSGKEAVARAIHNNSARANSPFVVFNAATIRLSNMAGELFGIENQQGIVKVGAFEEAHNGTLFLDEIGEMSLEMQKLLLQFLSNKTFARIGGAKKVSVNVRIISSSSIDLELQIKKNLFRQDLYHRLAVVPLAVPSLSQRRADIPELINAFMKQIELQTGVRSCPINHEAMAILQSYDWHGNLRQLRNNVERIMLLSSRDKDGIIGVKQLPQELNETLSLPKIDNGNNFLSLPLREARLSFEKDYLLKQLSRFDGNISRTANFVGMERSALHRKLKLLDL